MADPQIQQLDQLSGDPSLTAYVDAQTGAVSFRSATNDAATLAQRAAAGLQQATAEDIERRKRYLENTTAAAQAASAAKLATNVATFGLTHTQGDTERLGDFKDKSPTLAMLSEVAGGLAPGLAGGAVAGAAMRGLGFAERAAHIGALVGEEVAQSGAIEAENATLEGRDIDVANVISGIPLAMGMSAAARVARVGSDFASHAAAKLARRAEGALPDVASDANAISKGAATSRARRSVGAAGAADEARVPLSEDDVRFRVENETQLAAEAEKLGGDAIEDAVGGHTPTLDAVHNVGHKNTDFIGKMGDANPDAIGKAVGRHTASLEELAASLEGEGQKGFGRELREHLGEIDAAWNVLKESPEDMAVALDRTKRTLWRYRDKYGAVDDIRAEGFVQQIDNVANKLLKDLESKRLFGSTWSEAQATRNAIWSAKETGLIDSAKWMKGLLEVEGKTWRGGDTKPVMRLVSGWQDKILALDDRAFKRKITQIGNWVEANRKMNLTITELNLPSAEKTPLMRHQMAVDDIELFRDELLNMRETAQRGGPHKAKMAAVTASRGALEQAFELGKEIPGVGQALKLGENVAVKARGGRPLFEAPIEPPRPEISREAARKAVRGRVKPQTPYTPPSDGGGAIPPPGPRSVDPRPEAPDMGYAPQAESRRRQAGSASVGAMAGAAGLGVAALAAHPVTQLLKNMNDDQKAVRERAALGLVAPATRAPPLPSTIARFREGQRTLAESFELRKDDLITALSNPESLLAGLDDAFGDLGDSHPEMYGALVARAHAAAQYVMAEAPPSVAIGLTRPDGIPPDALSMAKFADIWSGAFNPGDVIYDVGTGSATPTQVKALKDVHPDVFDALRLDVLKAVGDAGGKVPFETLRKLDVLFDVPGIAPPSFQPQMSKTMQQAWSEPAGGNRKASSSESVGPGDPTAKFGAGPSTMK